MKRMLLASALATALFLTSNAQITVTNAVFPSIGDSLHFAVDEEPLGINPATPPGGPQVWDFSTLQKDDDFPVVYRSTAEGAFAANFPGANLMVKGQQGETYYRKSNTKLEVMGFAGASPDFLNLQINGAKFSPPIVEKKAPLKFFDIDQQTASLRLTFPTTQPPLDSIFANLPIKIDSMRVKVNTERLEVVDGWGQVTIPGGTYPVLRQRRTDYTTTGIDVYVVPIPGFGTWVDLSTIFGGGGGGGVGNFIGTDTTVSYRFLNDVQKEEIAVATMDNDLATVASVRYKNLASSPTKEVANEWAGGIQAFPNPAVEWVRFDCTNLAPGEYTLKIFNVVGKLVWKKNYNLAGTTSFVVDLDDFKKGSYIYSLVDKNGNAVGTKRLVVLKP